MAPCGSWGFVIVVGMGLALHTLVKPPNSWNTDFDSKRIILSVEDLAVPKLPLLPLVVFVTATICVYDSLASFVHNILQIDTSRRPGVLFFKKNRHDRDDYTKCESSEYAHRVVVDDVVRTTTN